jgi:sulfane dehydrogenase subunit SoxC
MRKRQKEGAGGPTEATESGRTDRRPGEPVSRRGFVAGAAGTLGAAALWRWPESVGRVFGPQDAVQPADSAASGGRPVYEPTGAGLPSALGTRSPYDRPRRIVLREKPDGSSLTPLGDLHGILTPADLHFERHHSGIPPVDPADYRLLIHGMVERPTVFTMRDLTRFPSRTVLRFIECAGNGMFGYRDAEPRMPPAAVAGLTSTSQWTGVPLSLLFREVGVDPKAKWFLAEGGDPGHYARSIPVAKAHDDAMIVYGQNGDAVRPEQGYPARLLVPGFEGSANIKWIHRIELSDAPFLTRAETSEYTDPLPNGTARIYSLVLDATSVITFPAYPVSLPDRGWWEISGLAWSGRGRIERVDVTTDGGKTWGRAELETPRLPRCHTRFRYLWKWDGGKHVLASRATDETGYIQPTQKELLAVRGPATLYHWNNIRAWDVWPDGGVTFAGGGDL